MNPHRLRAYFYLLLVAVIWGTAVPIIKFTLQGIDPLPFLSYRIAIASLVSIIFLKIGGVKLPKPKETFPLLLAYGFLAVPLALGALFTGLDKSTVLDLTLIGAIGPMVVIFGGALFFRDHITRKEKIGIGIVLVGVFINSFYPILQGSPQIRLTGNLFLIIFLLSDSASVLVAKRAVQNKVKPEILTNMAFIIGAIVLIPITLTAYPAQELVSSILTLPLKYHLGVWYMALLSGNLAYFLYVRAQRSIEVSEATLFSYLQPIFAVPLAIFWLGEKLTPRFIIGALIIATGLIIAEYKKQNS